MEQKKLTDSTEQGVISKKGVEEHKKVQTAEGWKRGMMKLREEKRKKSPGKK